MCYVDCFYEGEDSECMIKGFEKPKDGHCRGQFRCITCDSNPIDRHNFNKGVEICEDCLNLIKAYKKDFN